MKFRKAAAAAGVGVAGIVLFASAAGSAQAAPAKPVPAPVVSGEDVSSPMAFGSMINAARALAKGVAVAAKTSDNMLQHGSVFGVSAKVPEGVSVDAAFDR